MVTSRLLRDRVSVKTKVGGTRYNDSQGPQKTLLCIHFGKENIARDILG